MATTTIIVLRAFFASITALTGLFAWSLGLFLFADRDFVFFGGPGMIMVLCLSIGSCLLYASARLFKSTLSLSNS